MSSISKLLEIRGEKEILISGDIGIEGGGIYKGYEYLITFIKCGHRCGYVAITSDHPIYKFDDNDHPYPDFSVHGGVTFFGENILKDLIPGSKCTDKWIGFDAMHAYDSPNIETAEKYFGETRSITYIKLNLMPIISRDTEHRSYKYMEQECKNLIEQLLGYKND